MSTIHDTIKNIIHLAFMFDGYITGDYIFHIINRNDFSMLEIVFKDSDKLNLFTEIIECVYKGCDIMNQNEKWGHEFLFRHMKLIQDIHINIIHDPFDIVGTYLDFTCNGLKLQKNGLEVMSYFRNGPTDAIFTCIDDIQNKRFSILSMKNTMHYNDLQRYKDILSSRLKKAITLILNDFVMYFKPDNLLVFNNNSEYISKVIDLYPNTFSYDKIQYGLNDKCIYCMDSFEKDQYITISKCKHLFHTQCILDMLEKSQTSESCFNCPKCRFEHFLI